MFYLLLGQKKAPFPGLGLTVASCWLYWFGFEQNTHRRWISRQSCLASIGLHNMILPVHESTTHR